MDHRNLFGIASIILATGYLIRSFQNAEALPAGPNVNLGSNPYKAFYGTANQGSSNILTTSNEVFIITGVHSNDNTDISLYIDGQMVIPGSLLNSQVSSTYSGYWGYGYSINNLFLLGEAHLPIENGSTLSVECTNSNGCFYYIEGYYVHP
jgi:hypothetical protein